MWREAFAWRVPIDDLSHASFNVSLVHITGEAAERYRERRQQRQATVANLTSARETADAVLAGKLSIHEIEDRPDIVNIQDHVAQEGQGAIPDRNAERLGRSDTAIILMRKIWLRELRALSEGRLLKKWSLPDTVVASSGI
jgi:5,5'-dehydrodivanillate O-demethylase oxygenase subunit